MVLQVAAGDAKAVVADVLLSNLAETVGGDTHKETETGVIQHIVLAAGVGLLGGSNVTFLGEDQNIDYAIVQQRCDLGFPLAQVSLDIAGTDIAIVQVAVGVACNAIACVPQRSNNGLSALLLGSQFVVGHGRGYTVAEDTVIAGYAQNSPGTMVGKIDMLCNKLFQNGNHVVAAGDGGAVCQGHLVVEVAIFVYA